MKASMRWMGMGMVLVVASLSSVARAAGDEDLAKKYFTLGEELYNRADYEGALKQFQQAYGYSKKPALLYNMARCYESLGREDEAIKNFEAYVASKPGEEVERQVRSRVENLRRTWEKKKAERDRVAADRARHEEERRQLEASRRQTRVTEAPAPRRGALGIAGWTTLGAGGVLLVVGAIMGGLAKANASALEEDNLAGREFSEVAGKESRGKTFQKVAFVGLGVGAVAAVTGGVLLVLHYRRPRTESRVSIAPLFGPHGAGLHAAFRF